MTTLEQKNRKLAAAHKALEKAEATSRKALAKRNKADAEAVAAQDRYEDALAAVLAAREYLSWLEDMPVPEQAEDNVPAA